MVYGVKHTLNLYSFNNILVACIVFYKNNGGNNFQEHGAIRYVRIHRTYFSIFLTNLNHTGMLYAAARQLQQFLYILEPH